MPYTDTKSPEAKASAARAQARYGQTTHGRAKRLAATQRWRENHPLKNQSWSLFSSLQKRAKRKGLAVTVTREWIIGRLIRGHCAVTGLPFDNTRWAFKPSIDRIDNTKGYEQRNCRLVLFGYNALKADGTDADVLTIAEAICRKGIQP